MPILSLWQKEKIIFLEKLKNKKAAKAVKKTALKYDHKTCENEKANYGTKK